MTTQARLEQWCQMLMANDSRVQFQLAMPKGTVWKTMPPYPDLEIIEAKDVHVRRFVVQDLLLRARMEETEEEGCIAVRRLVAELENGSQMDLSLSAVPASDDSPAEPGDVCAACELKIVDESELVLHEGKPYHRRCMC